LENALCESRGLFLFKEGKMAYQAAFLHTTVFCFYHLIVPGRTAVFRPPSQWKGFRKTELLPLQSFAALKNQTVFELFRPYTYN
jgi:hypothetical protein